MKEEFSRTARILGQEGMARLYGARVIVFGVGGVGGHVIEALARCGIGTIDIVDDDTVGLSNINRQIIAMHSTLGRPKVEVMAEHIHDICGQIRVNTYQLFVGPETIDTFEWQDYDYVVDAVDTVTAKLLIAERAIACGVPVISCMGTGNKLHPEMLEITDIYKTSVCPLARVMRREAKARHIKKLKVLYSKEVPVKNTPEEASKDQAAEHIQTPARPGQPKKYVPGSISFVPSAAGLMIGGEVIRTIAGVN